MAGGGVALVVGAVFVFGLGVLVADAYAKASGRSDPPEVVIDEVSGQLIALSVMPLDPLAYGVAFVLFRVADIAKPWPVSWADRDVKGGLGIMLDDVFAGIYAAAGGAIVLSI